MTTTSAAHVVTPVGLAAGLSLLNTQLGALGDLPPETWHEWLWGTNPEEEYHMDVLLNRNHLLGLLVCRYKHLNQTESSLGSSGFSQGNRMTIMDKPVHLMTWRELKDTMANVLLEWPAFLDRLKQNIRGQVWGAGLHGGGGGHHGRSIGDPARHGPGIGHADSEHIEANGGVPADHVQTHASPGGL